MEKLNLHAPLDRWQKWKTFASEAACTSDHQRQVAKVSDPAWISEILASDSRIICSIRRTFVQSWPWNDALQKRVCIATRRIGKAIPQSRVDAQTMPGL
jgi:hypothetical protein